MIRMTLADYAKIHGQAKAASDFGVTHRTAISGRGWKKPLSSAYNSDRR